MVHPFEPLVWHFWRRLGFAHRLGFGCCFGFDKHFGFDRGLGFADRLAGGFGCGLGKGLGFGHRFERGFDGFLQSDFLDNSLGRRRLAGGDLGLGGFAGWLDTRLRARLVFLGGGFHCLSPLGTGLWGEPRRPHAGTGNEAGLLDRRAILAGGPDCKAAQGSKLQKKNEKQRHQG